MRCGGEMEGVRGRATRSLLAAFVCALACAIGVPAAFGVDGDEGSVATAWQRPETWPARYARTREDRFQGMVVELVGRRDEARWGSIDARSAVALELWDSLADGQALLSGLAGRDDERVGEGGDERGGEDHAKVGVGGGVMYAEPGKGGFGFVRWPRQEGEPMDDPAPAAAMMFVSGQKQREAMALAIEPATGEGDAAGLPMRMVLDRVVLERTWFSLYDPRSGPARGIAVMMPGLFGTPEAVFDQMVRHLQARGWVVLRMMAQPSRYTEALDVQVDPEDVEKAAAVCAEVFGQRVAECAYAVEAALAWAREKRPEIAGKPAVILGGSGGAMSLPTVVARMPQTFDAAVLIAGGSDFATIAVTSNYVEWVDSVRISFGGGRPTPAQLEAFGEAYLSRSPLDSYHTASALEGTPVLMLHASRDRAVPAAQGEQLWERLGKPERRVYTMGHETIFISLPLRYGSIMDWLDERVPRGGGG